ncbi:MAG: hypothetical protein ACYC42_00415 [Lysobacter sp.]
MAASFSASPAQWDRRMTEKGRLPEQAAGFRLDLLRRVATMGRSGGGGQIA